MLYNIYSNREHRTLTGGDSYIIRKQGAFPLKFNTKLLHGGFGPEKTTGSTLTPIYQVSAFAQESAEQLEKVFNNKAPGYAYTRISNPTVAAFENRMNTLEKVLAQWLVHQAWRLLQCRF